MPPLNDDVLNEIFHEIFRNPSLFTWTFPRFEHSKENGRSLEKFMLAAKEPFKIALKNFTHASIIDIFQDEMIFTVNFKVRWFKARGFLYSHNFFF